MLTKANSSGVWCFVFRFLTPQDASRVIAVALQFVCVKNYNMLC